MAALDSIAREDIRLPVVILRWHYVGFEEEKIEGVGASVKRHSQWRAPLYTRGHGT
jgi:hypothetical protein